MEHLREIAIEISAVQSGLAAGDLTSLTAQEELNKIRRAALAMSGDMPELEVISGYRADAIGQAMMLAKQIRDTDMHTVPDSGLFHISACAEMVVEKIGQYFRLRNDTAISNMQKEAGNG